MQRYLPAAISGLPAPPQRKVVERLAKQLVCRGWIFDRDLWNKPVSPSGRCQAAGIRCPLNEPA